MTSTRGKRKHQRRHRRLKLRYLRKKLTETRAVGERQRLIEKMRKITPNPYIPE